MILTGSEIRRQVNLGGIVIDPFDEAQVQPNSYDFRLGSRILVYRDVVLDSRRENPTRELAIPRSGLELAPGRIYLAHTLERMGSTRFVPILRAKSSIARLGVFIHVTADLIDIGSINQWTLQLHPVQPTRIYAGMLIGQVTFWTTLGAVRLYDGKYQGSMGPQSSKVHLDFEALPLMDEPVTNGASSKAVAR